MEKKAKVGGQIQLSLFKTPEQVVMESTGIYWKSPYAALEAVGIIH